MYTLRKILDSGVEFNQHLGKITKLSYLKKPPPCIGKPMKNFFKHWLIKRTLKRDKLLHVTDLSMATIVKKPMLYFKAREITLFVNQVKLFQT